MNAQHEKNSIADLFKLPKTLAVGLLPSNRTILKLLENLQEVFETLKQDVGVEIKSGEHLFVPSPTKVMQYSLGMPDQVPPRKLSEETEEVTESQASTMEFDQELRSRAHQFLQDLTDLCAASAQFIKDNNSDQRYQSLWMNAVTCFRMAASHLPGNEKHLLFETIANLTKLALTSATSKYAKRILWHCGEIYNNWKCGKGEHKKPRKMFRPGELHRSSSLFELSSLSHRIIRDELTELQTEILTAGQRFFLGLSNSQRKQMAYTLRMLRCVLIPSKQRGEKQKGIFAKMWRQLRTVLSQQASAAQFKTDFKQVFADLFGATHREIIAKRARGILDAVVGDQQMASFGVLAFTLLERAVNDPNQFNAKSVARFTRRLHTLFDHPITNELRKCSMSWRAIVADMKASTGWSAALEALSSLHFFLTSPENRDYASIILHTVKISMLPLLIQKIRNITLPRSVVETDRYKLIVAGVQVGLEDLRPENISIQVHYDIDYKSDVPLVDRILVIKL